MPPPPVPSGRAADLPNNVVMQMRKPWPKRDNGQPRIGGPNVFTPGQLHHTVDIPDFFAESPKQAGYQAAHNMYDEMRNYFVQRAYATNNVELVVVKVTMKWMKPGNKNPSIVSVSGLNH